MARLLEKEWMSVMDAELFKEMDWTARPGDTRLGTMMQPVVKY